MTNLTLVEKIANAVLYEGYMLYPYRASSVKNRQRWTFGGIYPRAYSEAQAGNDAWTTQAEVLVAGEPDSAAPRVELWVRFLHLVARDVGVLDERLAEIPSRSEPAFHLVGTLEIGDQLYQAWQEAVERDVQAGQVALDRLADNPRRIDFSFPAQRALEYLRAPDGAYVGVIARSRQAIQGAIELAVECAGDNLFKLRARVLNLTPFEDVGAGSRDAALMRAFASTHLVLGVQGGAFVSLLDPPEAMREAAASCQNIGVWPVLVGQSGERDTLLASPIILYDYPEIAPESPGDLFDGTEIDEILTLRIMTMTEQEKREMGAVDARARALLERTESLAREELMRLHGTVRSLRPLRSDT
jgi:hydrogenase maturation protease